MLSSGTFAVVESWESSSRSRMDLRTSVTSLGVPSCMVLLMMNFIMVFSLCPLAQSALEIRFDNLFLVDILPVVECSDLECNFSVVGNPLGNVDCIPGIQVPRGFCLIELRLSYSLTLESEIGHKIANWQCQLVHQLVRKACRSLSAQ